MEPSWHVLGPEPARVGPAPGQYRRALHTNVCSALYAPSSQIILHSSRAAEVPGMLPHANAWQPTRKCAAH